MRNKKFINTLVLFGVCASLFSLASCQGIKGEQGEPGTPGENGKPGEDGKDGNTWLTGEGTPASSLGKNGDLYLDTATSDYYIKKDGSWVKTGNLKGEDGEDGKPGENGKPGQDGEDGANGSTGPKGDTAWSNTILPSANGYVTVDKGSAIENDAITFTFTPLDDEHKLTILELNTENMIQQVKPVENSNKSTLTVSMVPNGYVVAATFGKISTATPDKTVEAINKANPGDVITISGDGSGNNSIEQDIKVPSNVTVILDSEITTTKDITLSEGAKVEINKKVTTSGAIVVEENAKMTINAEVTAPAESTSTGIEVKENSVVELKSSANVSGVITTSGANAEIIMHDGCSVGGLVLSGNNSKVTNVKSAEVVSFLENDTTTTQKSIVKGTVFVTGDNIAIEGIKIDGSLLLGWNSSYKQLDEPIDGFSMNDCEYIFDKDTKNNSTGNATIPLNVKGDLSFEGSTFIANESTYNFFEQPFGSKKAILDNFVMKGCIVNMTGATHNAINLYNLADKANVEIIGNTFNGFDNTKSQILRLSDTNVGGTIERGSKIINFSGNTIERVKYDSNVLWNPWILIQEGDSTINQWTAEEYKIVFYKNKLINRVDTDNNKITNPTEEIIEIGELKSFEFEGAKNPYIENVFAVYKGTTLPTLCTDSATILGNTEENVFINGQLYSEAVYLNGTFNASHSTPVTGIKFNSGDGTTTPLTISTEEQFNLINDSRVQNILKVSALKFKLENDITLNGNYSGGCVINVLNGQLDGGNHLLKMSQKAIGLVNYVTSGLEIKDLKFDTNSNWLVYSNEFNSKYLRLKNVDVSGEYSATSSNTNNESAYVIFSFGEELSFIDCDASYSLNGNGWQGIFLGGYVSSAENEVDGKKEYIYHQNYKFVAKNLTYSGVAFAKHIGLLVGNSTGMLKNEEMYKKTTFDISGCVNNGKLTSYNKGNTANQLLCGFSLDNAFVPNTITTETLKNGTGTAEELPELNNVKATLSSDKTKVFIDYSKATSETQNSISSVEIIAYARANYKSSTEKGNTNYILLSEESKNLSEISYAVKSAIVSDTTSDEYYTIGDPTSRKLNNYLPNDSVFDIGTAKSVPVTFTFYFKDANGKVIGYDQIIVSKN